MKLANIRADIEAIEGLLDPPEPESPTEDAHDPAPYRARVFKVLPFRGTAAELAAVAGGKATRTRAALAALLGEGRVTRDGDRFARS